MGKQWRDSLCACVSLCVRACVGVYVSVCVAGLESRAMWKDEEDSVEERECREEVKLKETEEQQTL